MTNSTSVRVVVFADHEIGERLVRKFLESYLNKGFLLEAVVTTDQNNKRWWPPLEPLSRTHNIPLLNYPRDKSTIESMKGVDFFFLLSWKFILSQTILTVPKIGTLNLHYSLLPKYRGVYPVNQAIMHGERETGVTYHWVDSGVDTGNIICQKSCPILITDTARTLQCRLDDLALALFDELLVSLDSSGIPQPIIGSSYYSRSDFVSTNQLDVDATCRVGDFIDLLRGKTFHPHSENLYFIHGDGSKVYLSISLDKD